jgi:hypothetical protein
MDKVLSRSLDRNIGYSVIEIATPIDQLYCWDDDPDTQNQVLQQAFEDDITYLPDRLDGQIIGLRKRVERTVGETIPISPDWLITADTKILHLIELFAEKPDRVFLVLSSSEIVGLVAPADLNKVSARASVYLLTAHFEDALVSEVRQALNESEEELKECLSENRLQELQKEHAEAQNGDLALSLFHHLYLADLCTIVAKNATLRDLLGFSSRNQADGQLHGVTDLRNSVSHLTGPLLTSRGQVSEVNDTCGKIIQWIERMNNAHA